MVEQPIIQAAVFSVETFDGTKSKFEYWTASGENAAQISEQNILCITFSKMVGLPFTSTHRLRDHLPHLTWDDLQNKHLRQYSTIPFSSHATKAFTYL